jgi:elongation factor G
LQPVLCGAALRNRGVQQLLDGICRYLPSPADIEQIAGTDPQSGKPAERRPEPDEPLSLIAFKLQAEKHGDLFYLRVYSGELRERSRVYNANQEKMEHITHLYRMHANAREQIAAVGPGAIVAATGLRFTATGDTLCDRKRQIVYERMQIPETVIAMAIEPRTQAEKNKLHDALAKLAREDPTFRQNVDQQTCQLLISGMGELHLDIIRDRLQREFSVDARIGEPRVSYREGLERSVRIEQVFQKEIEGRGQFARVVIEFSPDSGSTAVAFANSVPKEALQPHFAKAVERSLTQSPSGVLYGFPLINVKAELVEAESRPVDSTELAFEAAASMALRRAFEEGGCQLYEPYMRLEIITPEDNVGDVISFVNSCRGAIQELHPREALRMIRAEAPLAQLFGFATKLRSMTQGRGTYSMEPLEYRRTESNTLDFA